MKDQSLYCPDNLCLSNSFCLLLLHNMLSMTLFKLATGSVIYVSS